MKLEPIVMIHGGSIADTTSMSMSRACSTAPPNVPPSQKTIQTTRISVVCRASFIAAPKEPVLGYTLKAALAGPDLCRICGTQFSANFDRSWFSRLKENAGAAISHTTPAVEGSHRNTNRSTRGGRNGPAALPIGWAPPGVVLVGATPAGLGIRLSPGRGPRTAPGIISARMPVPYPRTKTTSSVPSTRLVASKFSQAQHHQLQNLFGLGGRRAATPARNN